MANEHVKVWVQSQQQDSTKYPEYEMVSEGPPLVVKHKERGFFASRLPELGLTGYGDTADEARNKVERMFRSAVKAVRKLNGSNGLEDWLTRSGVTWEWSEGTEDELVYE